MSTAAPTRERAGRASAGFTLLELAVTLGLVALLAAAVAPRLATDDTRTLRLAAEDAARRITALRWRAVVEGRPLRLSLATLAPGLRATQPDGTAAGAESIVFEPLPAALARTIVLAGATGATARIIIPSGLAPVAVRVGAPS